MTPRPLSYSWILTNQLAIGPRPVSKLHWQQLEEAGLRGRFSCCYPEEEQSLPYPHGWQSAIVSLPDHRNQEELRLERLVEALSTADQLLDEGAPIYLHCLAGIERSPLLAVGLTARRRRIDVYAALDWVRRCHPSALPIYGHLELLEQVLNLKMS
ncbi:MAG: hypothetical protein WAM11_00940 [Cyanobium sp.]